ncbi:DUF1778 domain-containing protein [Rugamonas sp. DEMB1]|uniref:type II toxin-antitoxin system TacA family antitoxin n=1 Tax=Rugamonas sp. DEMB1 TaxID=3039386 RepID=UPI00244990F7|nr:DUF1778 domain-containing protein [Rugamonas sp. DEMB1]WGG49215.1 DUF1778 domain-containing protein [Rugamonas sp. DEMB1]
MNIPKNRDRTSNRVPTTIVETLQEAADLTGATLNQFMVQAALEKAEKLIAREKIIYFSKNDAAMIVNLLDNPAKPNAALVRAFERFTLREIENGNAATASPSIPSVD